MVEKRDPKKEWPDARKAPMFTNVTQIFESLRREASETDVDAFVFPGIGSRATAFSTALAAECKRIGIQGITSHVLRHTYSTWCNRFGVDAFAQKETLGHSRLAQTANYTHQSNKTFLGQFKGFEEHLQRRLPLDNRG
jgi:integrase